MRNPSIQVAGLIYGAPFFEFPKHSEVGLYKRLLVNSIKAMGEEIILSPMINVHWVCHEKAYFKKLMDMNGTVFPLLSGGISCSMIDCINDVGTFSHRHTLPVLLLTAGKDKVVDNLGAREFYKNAKTPPDLKQIKLFYNAYH